MSLADALNNRRLQVWNEMQELVDRTDAEGRSFSGEEESKWQNMNDEIGRIDERIKSVREAEARAKNIDAAMANKGNRKSLVTGPDAQAEFRAWATGQTASRVFDVRPTGPVNYRTLSKLSAGAGANTVPTSFYDRLMQHLIENGALMGAGVTVLNTQGGEQIQVPKTTSHSSAALTTEAGTISASDPVFGQVPLDAYKYAVLIKVSRELAQDSGVDLEGYLAAEAGQALGNAFGAHIVTGTGSSQPNGIVTAASSGVTGPTGATGGFGTQSTAGQGADVLIDLFHSVIAPYRRSAGCGWLMKDSTAATVRKIKDSTGQYIWQPSMVAGEPDLLLSKPVTIDPNVAAVALSAKSVIFGDFSKYFVRVAGGVRFERSDDFAFDTDLVTYRAVLRADGDLIDTTGAVKYFVGAAT